MAVIARVIRIFNRDNLLFRLTNPLIWAKIGHVESDIQYPIRREGGLMYFKSAWLARWAGHVSVLVLSIFFVSGVSAAQVAITGKIAGVVTDSSGAVVPNAMVTVTSSAQMAPRTTKTASDGAFLFDLLSPGDYQLTVTSGGFETYSQTGIVITPGFTASVSPKLQRLNDLRPNPAATDSFRPRSLVDRGADGGRHQQFVRRRREFQLSAVRHADPWQHPLRATVFL